MRSGSSSTERDRRRRADIAATREVVRLRESEEAEAQAPQLYRFIRSGVFQRWYAHEVGPWPADVERDPLAVLALLEALTQRRRNPLPLRKFLFYTSNL